MKSICFPPSAFCLLPTAYRVLRGVPVGGALGPSHSLRQDVIADRKKKICNFEKKRNEPGMLLKTKDRCRKRWNEAGMLCAPQQRGSPVGGSPTQILVGKSGS